MDSTENTTQLPLDIKVSAWSAFQHNFRKYIREFRYSSLGQVLGNFWFWLDGAFAGLLFWYVVQHPQEIGHGRGVLLAPASLSSVSSIQGSAVMWLSFLPYVAWAMLGIWGIASVVAVFLHGNGRPGIVTYVFLLTLLLLVLLARVILYPILLLGG